ncbi:MAG: hypothetical protein ACE14P_02430 [Methanotrichaceae archaeon]
MANRDRAAAGLSYDQNGILMRSEEDLIHICTQIVADSSFNIPKELPKSKSSYIKEVV